MNNAYLCDGIRTPIGRFGGGRSSLRADDLAALPLAADIPGTTINRLCGSGLDAMGSAARAVQCGQMDVAIAGGVESMSRAPFVMPKADSAFSRKAEIYDTTIGWRFVNPKMEASFGTHSMPETADNVAEDFGISRVDQDAFAHASQQKYAAAQKAGFFEGEICPVHIPQRKGDPIIISQDEHPRPSTSLDQLAKLRPINGEGKSVTAGNASGVNDGAAALLIASEVRAKRHRLRPMARILGMSCVGVTPRVMGIGPVPAVQKLLEQLQLDVRDMDVIELNEAFAAQSLAVLRGLDLPDNAAQVNPNGGAIALGHPLGMSGARLALTAARQLQYIKSRYALCTMCVGVGQGIALVMERV